MSILSELVVFISVTNSWGVGVIIRFDTSGGVRCLVGHHRAPAVQSCCIPNCSPYCGISLFVYECVHDWLKLTCSDKFEWSNLPGQCLNRSTFSTLLPVWLDVFNKFYNERMQFFLWFVCFICLFECNIKETCVSYRFVQSQDLSQIEIQRPKAAYLWSSSYNARSCASLAHA